MWYIGYCLKKHHGVVGYGIHMDTNKNKCVNHAINEYIDDANYEVKEIEKNDIKNFFNEHKSAHYHLFDCPYVICIEAYKTKKKANDAGLYALNKKIKI